MLARGSGQAELVFEPFAPALGVDRLQRGRRREEAEGDGRRLPGDESRRPEPHDAVLAVEDEGGERRIAQKVREDAGLPERHGVREEDVRLDVNPAGGGLALADRLLGVDALDDPVRPPRERPLVTERPGVVDQETREEVVDERGARVDAHTPSPPGSSCSAIAYSATGLPPTRCSVMIRSRTGGSQPRYHVPSG